MDPWVPRLRTSIVRSSFSLVGEQVQLDERRGFGRQLLVSPLLRPKGYIFPTIPACKNPPPASEWTPRLASPNQILALYAQQPWEAATRQITPISFPRIGWFDQLATLYLEFEDRNRQTSWESTHAIFFSGEERASDPELDKLWNQRKQRRSLAGPRWKAIVRFVLQGMIAGHFDLYILLDPFFLHFPSHREYPPGILVWDADRRTFSV